jgi:hypothetical protein
MPPLCRAGSGHGEPQPAPPESGRPWHGGDADIMAEVTNSCRPSWSTWRRGRHGFVNGRCRHERAPQALPACKVIGDPRPLKEPDRSSDLSPRVRPDPEQSTSIGEALPAYRTEGFRRRPLSGPCITCASRGAIVFSSLVSFVYVHQYSDQRGYAGRGRKRYSAEILSRVLKIGRRVTQDLLVIVRPRCPVAPCASPC